MGGSSGAARGVGTSNVEQSLKEFSLKKQRLRSKFNDCLPHNEVGGGEKGHEQTLL